MWAVSIVLPFTCRQRQVSQIGNQKQQAGNKYYDEMTAVPCSPFSIVWDRKQDNKIANNGSCVCISSIVTSLHVVITSSLGFIRSKSIPYRQYMRPSEHIIQWVKRQIGRSVKMKSNKDLKPTKKTSSCNTNCCESSSCVQDNCTVTCCKLRGYQIWKYMKYSTHLVCVCHT